MANRNLIKSNPHSNQNNTFENEIKDLSSDTNKQDTVFYEYEVVDKPKENKLARKQAWYHGLCVFSRWFFLFAGNVFLIAIICIICAILLYANSPSGYTSKPLTYGQSCTLGSTICDSVAGLTCNSSFICDCSSNQYWNDTDCICPLNSTFDGLACLTAQGYSQPCSSSEQCFNLFTCDSDTNTCLCPSVPVSYYTQYYNVTYSSQYWTGGAGDLYGYSGGKCQYKQSWGGLYLPCISPNPLSIPCTWVSCNTYGNQMCQQDLGLTCNYGLVGAYNIPNWKGWRCMCDTGYYWSAIGSAISPPASYTTVGINIGCVPQITTVGTSCANAGYMETPCSSNLNLLCDPTTKTCQCSSNYYFNTNTNLCTLKGNYMDPCLFDSWCNSTIGLTCFDNGVACSCPTNNGYWYCDCKKGTSYWDNQQCSNLLASGSKCSANYMCSSSSCAYGYCQ